MFCIHIKPKRIHLLFICAPLFTLCAVFALVCHSPARVATMAGARTSGDSSSERLDFIRQFGWEVEEDPVAVEDVIIPSQFGDVYENYNALQLQQGFDLLPYAGRVVKKWTYAVTNYPGYSDSSVYVRITLLVCQGIIIGGDVCSVELNGFMHGFAYESMNGT